MKFGSYFIYDENNFKFPLLQVGSRSDDKVSDPDPTGQKSLDPHPCLWDLLQKNEIFTCEVLGIKIG